MPTAKETAKEAAKDTRGAKDAKGRSAPATAGARAEMSPGAHTEDEKPGETKAGETKADAPKTAAEMERERTQTRDAGRDTRMGWVGKEADHSGAAQAKTDRETAARELREGNRQKLKSGHLSGKWVQAGSSLVSMENLFEIDFSGTTDGANPSVTLRSAGGATKTLAGDDAREFMEEMGLTALKARTPDATENVTTDSGQIISARDAEAMKVPGRITSVPDRMHRANAVGTNAETDAEVTARAGVNPIPPTRAGAVVPAPVGAPEEAHALAGSKTDTGNALSPADVAATDARAKAAEEDAKGDAKSEDDKGDKSARGADPRYPGGRGAKTEGKADKK